MYSEKENFSRILHFDHPSHVCYPPPSRGGCYFGGWPAESRPSAGCLRWTDEWGVGGRTWRGKYSPRYRRWSHTSR